MQTQPKPLKRSKSLTILSHEHHEILLFVWEIRQGMIYQVPASTIGRYCAWFWEHMLREHFEKEEKLFSGLIPETDLLLTNVKDDHELLDKGMMIYDALYSWAKYLQKEKHTQNPVDHLFIDVYNKYLKQASATKKTPSWVAELKQIIQDQVESNLNLTAVSKSLELHPAYLSREFSKYFNNLSFGEYVRKLRIENAIRLMQTNNFSLTQIAYLTGFSDQSHFSRIFKQHTGKSPSAYKKAQVKGKSKDL